MVFGIALSVKFNLKLGTFPKFLMQCVHTIQSKFCSRWKQRLTTEFYFQEKSDFYQKFLRSSKWIVIAAVKTLETTGR